MPPHAYRAAILIAGMMAVGAVSLLADDKADRTVREGFESEKTSWRREETDATVTVQAHDRSTRAAHEGRTSERFSFRAGAGSVLYYSHSLPKIPVTPNLRASLFVRSNRPGVQVFGRVVLPEDLDPDTGRPSFLLIPGESVTAADRWERLDLEDIQANLARQARVLRVGTNRKVSLVGAYLERLVVNLYGGAGETEVFLDEMSVSPVPDAGADEKPDPEDEELPPPLPGPIAAVPGATEPKDTSRVRLVGSQLIKDNVDWVPSVIYAPGADPMVLRQHGFDVLALDRKATDAQAEEAARVGFLLMPTLPDGPDVAPETVVAMADRHPQRDRVAFWNLGDDLGSEPDLKSRDAGLDRARKIISGLRDLPDGRSRLTFGTVEDYLPKYALAGRNLDLVGIRADDWGSMRDPKDTFLFLKQRRELTAVKNPHAPFLYWVQASAPPESARNVWGSDDPPSWGRPQVQPDQIRQSVYTALSAGYRAIGFKADAEITGPAGRARLLEMALLNNEIDLVESIIAKGAEPIQFHNTFNRDPEIPLVFTPLGSVGGMNTKNNPATKPAKEVPPHPTIKAAAIPTADGRGRLLLVNDYSPTSQFQPTQMAVNDLNVVIPVAENAVGLEINPAGVTVLKSERSTGGRRFVLPLFSGTAMVLITTDLSMKDRLEAEIARNAPMATEFAIRQAQAEIAEATEIHGLLARDGHTVRDANDLLAQANDLVKSAIEKRDQMDYALAWSESKRVGRALRVLKRNHWDKAYREMVDSLIKTTRAEYANGKKYPYPYNFAIASPPLTAFQTLPQHFIWQSWIREERGSFGDNLLPSGRFEVDGAAGLLDAGWTDASHETENVETKFEVLESAGYGGDNAALRLVVAPKARDEKAIDKLVPYLDHPAIALKSPPIKVHRNGLFRIRFLFRTNRAMPSGTGGLIVRDSLGGEPYQYRLTTVSPLWREATLYRFAPDDGEMTVTLGLAGYGDCYFDDIRVDTITSASAPRVRTETPIARRPRPPRVNPEGSAGAETRPRR